MSLFCHIRTRTVCSVYFIGDGTILNVSKTQPGLCWEISRVVGRMKEGRSLKSLVRVELVVVRDRGFLSGERGEKGMEGGRGWV